ncbi:HDIG domain-containing protein, partial [bacterium]
KPTLGLYGILALAAVCAVAAVLAGPGIKVGPLLYQEGEIAEKSVRAQQDFLLTDDEATQRIRAEAPLKAPTVFDLNPAAAEQSLQALAESLSVAYEPEVKGQGGAEQLTVPQKISKALKDRWSLSISGDLARDLAKEEGKKEIYRLVGENLRPYYERGVAANRDLLLRESAGLGAIVVRDLSSGAEKAVAEVSFALDFETARAELYGARQGVVTSPERLGRALAAELLTPNFSLNREESAARKKAASESTGPVYYQVRKGETIVREGDIVTGAQAKKLAQMAQKTTSGSLLLANASLFASLFLITFLCLHFGLRNIKKTRTSPKDLLFLATLFLSVILVQRMGMYVGARLEPDSAELLRFAMPVSAAFIVARMVLNSETVIVFAIPFIAASSFCAGLESGFFLPLIAGGVLGGHLGGSARKRIDFFKIGFLIGVVQGFAVALFIAQKSGALTVAATWPIAGAFLGGIMGAVLAMTIVPLAEALFGYTTDMRLMELASLDHPLLKDLMLHAPGSYHHSVVVGTLVKGAAEAIGARAVLAMVAAYYHDIGKLAKAAYFIENQSGGKNPHDKLSPTMSSLILSSHVKEGVEMAKKHRLGQEITDIIEQHHGTRRMAYFYEKAKASGEEIPETEFTYPGPKPQSREAALIMLADVVEAAVRTLPNATQPRIQGTVQNMINRIFAEGQLDECDLALKDLHKIARSFTHILTAMHHHRIDYPQPVSKDRRDDGDSDTKRQPEGHGGRGEANQESPESLKRLGL